MEPKNKNSKSNKDFKETRSTVSNSPTKKPLFSQQEMDLIKKRKEQKEKSIEEKLKEVVITTTEKKSLKRVFASLSGSKKYFDGKDISRVLKLMDVHLTKSEIDLMIWVKNKEKNNSYPQKKLFRKLMKIWMIKSIKKSLKTCTKGV